MSFKQKTWTDRISQYPTRRTLTDVSDNTTKTVTVAREEGTISQEGDAFSAANMNDLEQRVADGFSTVSQDSIKIATKNTTSDSIAFGIDSNGNYGYIKEGADTVTPFKSQADINNAYNSGVADADARVNTSSASYNSGYTNGKAAPTVTAKGSTHVDNYTSTSFYLANGVIVTYGLNGDNLETQQILWKHGGTIDVMTTVASNSANFVNLSVDPSNTSHVNAYGRFMTILIYEFS